MAKYRTPETKQKPNPAQGSSRGPVGPLVKSKYEQFAQLVAEGKSPAKAYVLCGYSANGALQSGHRLLRRTEVAARIEALKTAVSERQVEKTAVDHDWVVTTLVENIRRAMQLVQVRDRQGNPTGQYTYQGGVANKALELLGKEWGMFQSKNENPVDVQEMINELNEGRRSVAEERAEREANGDPTKPK